MNNTEIQRIFDAKYNRSDWIRLIHDVFKGKETFLSKPQEILVEKAIAERVYYLGVVTLENAHKIAIYEVKLSNHVNVERNRAGIRNLLCSTWRGLGFVGAFMLCHRESESVLRFSYVSESFRFDENGKYSKDSTDPKRFTYLLGEGHRSKTAVQQFVALKNSELTLQDVTKAFSVEAVSKRFFDEYKKNYENIVEYVTGKRVQKVKSKWEMVKTHAPNKKILEQFDIYGDTEKAEKAVRDYVKKLMGRLVFIQFLQKKGWMGVPANDSAWKNGDRDFVQNLFKKTENKETFVDDVLEPLFEDLNTKRKNDLVSNAKVGRNIKVPYLNGGLFEKDVQDNMEFPLPVRKMQDLLDFFTQYNFTIDENDPNDAEVGVDPEMLSCIFENLLEDNKDKGAFYTPKEIVHYMCRESLIAYLETECSKVVDSAKIREFIVGKNASVFNDDEKKIILEKLCDVKICDPAIGSGAFPMGLMRELYFCRSAIEGFGHEKAAEIKKHIIQQNIYGVDIEKGAVDIARLRFWLSLIVDEENPHALPNLDFKIMQGNSLLEQYEGVDLSDITYNATKKEKLSGKLLDLFDSGEIASKKVISLLKDSFFSCEDHEIKRQIRDALKKEIQALLKEKACSVKLDDVKDVTATDRFFLWHTWFSEVFEQGGFDIVIGNPPYIKEYTNKVAFDGFRESSPYYMGKMDLWYGFACHGIDLLRAGGILCFIAQNNWTTSAGAKKMRNKVVCDSKIRQLLDFNTYMIFENASIQTMVMLFERNTTGKKYVFDYRALLSKSKKEDMFALLDKKLTEKTRYLNPQINRAKHKDSLLTFTDNDALFEKIARDKIFLTDDEIAQGIVFPQDFLDRKGSEKLGGKYPIGSGIFALSQDEMISLNLNQDEKGLIKPYFTTEQIHKFYVEPKNSKWMIYTDSSFKDVKKMKNYPNVKKHLDRFANIITSDNKPYGLHRSRKEDFFKGEKIISLRKCPEGPCFSYSDSDCYVTQTFFSIKTLRWNMKFLTGILNSNLIAYWLKNKGKMQGENYQVDKEPLLGIPLPRLAIVDKHPVIDLVNKILAAKKENPQADTSGLEHQIDKHVYDLYDLKPDEVDVIEGSNNA